MTYPHTILSNRYCLHYSFHIKIVCIFRNKFSMMNYHNFLRFYLVICDWERGIGVKC